MPQDLVSVILPTYNEVENIVVLIRDIIRNLKKLNFEVIVVDDNSPDRTAKLAKEKFKKDNRIKVFIRRFDRGLAKSILFGIEKSRGQYIIVMDTDFNHDPHVLPKFLSYKNKYPLIIGSRYIKGGGMEDKTRYSLSMFYNLAVRFILSSPTKDNLSGFFLIKRKELENFNLKDIFQGYGDYFIRLLKYANQNNLRIKEIPVYYKNRSFGQSKSRFFHMFFDYSKTVFEVLLYR